MLHAGPQNINGLHMDRLLHACCWDTFYISAYCGSVVEIPTELLRFNFLFPFQRQPRLALGGWSPGLLEALGFDESRRLASMLRFATLGATQHPDPRRALSAAEEAGGGGDLEQLFAPRRWLGCGWG